MNKLHCVLSLLLVSVLILAGGGQTVEAAQEAPMLKAKVDAGQLPALEERLPKDQVVTPAWNDGIGKYGGIIRVVG